jgi:predicted dehydrogenase
MNVCSMRLQCLGIIVTGADYGVAAAQKGLHILIEKPMAADYAGAVALYGAAKKAGVTLMVNWPFAWWPISNTH